MNDEISQNIKKASQYWAAFLDKLNKLIGQDKVDQLVKENLSLSDFIIKYDLLKTSAVKKHISSTHTWIKGKQHYSKDTDNYYEYPFECKICKMGASGYDGELKVEDNTPSRDGHNHLINRTCQEVLNDKILHRKTRKDKKCITCCTYGCHFPY